MSNCGKVHDGEVCMFCGGQGAAGHQRGGGSVCGFCCGTGRLLKRPEERDPEKPRSAATTSVSVGP